MHSEALQLLGPLSFFEDFADDWLDHVYGLAALQTTKAGDYLLRESEEGHEVFILLEGELAIEVSLPQSRSKEVVASLKPGDLLGEFALLGYIRRSASARAVDDVNTLAWQRDDLDQLFASRPEIGYAFMTALARSLAAKLISTNYSAAFFHAFYKSRT